MAPPKDECIPWRKIVGGDYATTRDGQQAHRATWTAMHGEIPEGMVIHHSCENKWCVNTDHLLMVTPKQHRHHHSPGVAGTRTIKLQDELYNKIKATAKEEDRPIATIIRRAFYLYAERPFKEAERER